ncbi:MAG: CDP-alcohol phosphatidyltransferase family protein [Chloroflexota bacterium]|nr:CDP-alcohol phosphatidyltransferase family protein [Chloroflexota bacterium]
MPKPTFRQRARTGAEPVARVVGRLGVSPNALTLIGFIFAVAAAVFAGAEMWLAAALLVAVGAAFDMLDGALARATNRLTRLGAFLDSTFDRAGEAVVYIGIAVAYARSDTPEMAVVPMAAMATAFMVSYTRAKSESLGFTPGSGMANVGFAPREVRVVILAVGLLLTHLGGGLGRLPWPEQGAWWLAVTLGLITILATATTIQRIVHVIIQARKE